MATSKNQKSSLILILIAFFMEFLAILVLLPNNYLERQIRKEQMIIANRFNDDTIKWLSAFSRDAHKQVIYDSGFYDALHHTLHASLHAAVRSRWRHSWTERWRKDRLHHSPPSSCWASRNQ